MDEHPPACDGEAARRPPGSDPSFDLSEFPLPPGVFIDVVSDGDPEGSDGHSVRSPRAYHVRRGSFRMLAKRADEEALSFGGVFRHGRGAAPRLNVCFEAGGVAGLADEGTIVRVLGDFVVGVLYFDPLYVSVRRDDARERFRDYEEE